MQAHLPLSSWFHYAGTALLPPTPLGPAGAPHKEDAPAQALGRARAQQNLGAIAVAEIGKLERMAQTRVDKATHNLQSATDRGAAPTRLAELRASLSEATNTHRDMAELAHSLQTNQDEAEKQVESLTEALQLYTAAIAKDWSEYEADLATLREDAVTATRKHGQAAESSHHAQAAMHTAQVQHQQTAAIANETAAQFTALKGEHDNLYKQHKLLQTAFTELGTKHEALKVSEANAHAQLRAPIVGVAAAAPLIAARREHEAARRQEAETDAIQRATMLGDQAAIQEQLRVERQAHAEVLSRLHATEQAQDKLRKENQLLHTTVVETQMNLRASHAASEKSADTIAALQVHQKRMAGDVAAAEKRQREAAAAETKAYATVAELEKRHEGAMAAMKELSESETRTQLEDATRELVAKHQQEQRAARTASAELHRANSDLVKKQSALNTVNQQLRHQLQEAQDAKETIRTEAVRAQEEHVRAAASLGADALSDLASGSDTVMFMDVTGSVLHLLCT